MRKNRLHCPCGEFGERMCRLAVCQLLCFADSQCPHTWLVYLFLSPAISNWSGFQRLSADQADELDQDSDSDDADDVDGDREFLAAYTYKHCRLPEEDSSLRKKLSELNINCPDSACPMFNVSAPPVGVPKPSCKHTYPTVFKPPEALTSCARCGKHMSFQAIHFVSDTKVPLDESVCNTHATLFTLRHIIEDCWVFKKTCTSCKAVYYPYLADQGWLHCL